MKTNSKQHSDYLREQLVDARDGLLPARELARLEKEVKAHDPGLWKDHMWMMEQAQSGVLSRFSDLREVQPAEGAIDRFHARRDAEGGTQADLEFLVWSWFRRYVLTVGLVLIVLFTGLQWGTTDEPAGEIRDQMTRILSGEPEQIPELNHWLYDDL